MVEVFSHQNIIKSMLLKLCTLLHLYNENGSCFKEGQLIQEDIKNIEKKKHTNLYKTHSKERLAHSLGIKFVILCDSHAHGS